MHTEMNGDGPLREPIVSGLFGVLLKSLYVKNVILSAAKNLAFTA